MKMTKKQRQCPKFVIEVVMDAFKKFGMIQADCGHYIFPDEEVCLIEWEDGRFFVICHDCYYGGA